MLKKTNQAKGKRVPLLEWVSAAVGLLILVGLFGFLAMEAVKTSEEKPPMMIVEETGISAYSDRYIIEVKLVNHSRKTGAAIQIEGRLSTGGTSVETSNATVDYVPGKSERRAGLVFTKDPRKYDVELRVTGYELP